MGSFLVSGHAVRGCCHVDLRTVVRASLRPQVIQLDLLKQHERGAQSDPIVGVERRRVPRRPSGYPLARLFWQPQRHE